VLRPVPDTASSFNTQPDRQQRKVRDYAKIIKKKGSEEKLANRWENQYGWVNK
jgi:hypothetical protein